MNRTWLPALLVSALAGLASVPLYGQTVYEGFDVAGLVDGDPLGTGVGAGSLGFRSATSWSFLQGSGEISYLDESLNYIDSEGNELSISGGAIRVAPAENDSLLARPLAATLDSRPDTYWISYLLRLDAPDPGDVYWTPDATWQVAAAGLQGTHDFRFINGNFARDGLDLIQASQNETHLVVVEVLRADDDGSGDTAHLWIDPVLTDPGPANAFHESTSFFDSIRDATDFLMLFGQRLGSIYSVDEFRIGESFEGVAPLAGGSVEVCGDFDSDGDVDSSDFTTVILSWTGGLDPGVGGRTFADGDCDGDADVDSSDLTSVIIGWTGSRAVGQPVGPLLAPSGTHHVHSVAEPSGTLSAVAALMLLAAFPRSTRTSRIRPTCTATPRLRTNRK